MFHLLAKQLNNVDCYSTSVCRNAFSNILQVSIFFIFYFLFLLHLHYIIMYISWNRIDSENTNFCSWFMWHSWYCNYILLVSFLAFVLSVKYNIYVLSGFCFINIKSFSAKSWGSVIYFNIWTWLKCIGF